MTLGKNVFNTVTQHRTEKNDDANEYCQGNKEITNTKAVSGIQIRGKEKQRDFCHVMNFAKTLSPPCAREVCGNRTKAEMF